MNETLIITGQSEINAHIVGPHSAAEHMGFDFMMILRILWYIICVAKVISIAFFSRPKPSIRERVLRKFLISHNELLRSFNEDDKKAMQQILDNTIKNASSRHETQGSRIRKSTKKVNFTVDRNDYYEYRQWKEQQEPHFLDVIQANMSTMHLTENSSFQEKQHEQEFIQREDLLLLDEKTEKLAEEEESGDEETQPMIDHLEENMVGISEEVEIM